MLNGTDHAPHAVRTSVFPVVFRSIFEAAHEVGASGIPTERVYGAVSFDKRDLWRLVVGGVFLGHLTRSALRAMLL